MPIYVYRCSHCDHTQDVLQKMSDPVLTRCPECGQSTYEKQVTAAAFRLKGTGWYETDFKNSGKKPPESGETSTKAASSDTASGTSSTPASSGTSGTPASSSGSGVASTASAG